VRFLVSLSIVIHEFQWFELFLFVSVDLAKAQSVDPSKQKQKDKRVAELDELVKAKARELTTIKFRSTIVAMVTVIGMYTLLSNKYDSSSPYLPPISPPNLPCHLDPNPQCKPRTY
jgi:hypothetical protein